MTQDGIEDDDNRDEEAIPQTTEKDETMDEKEETNGHGRCYRLLSRLGCECLARLPGQWPRTFAVLFGVVAPVLYIILISMFFGYFLAELEATSEIAANNQVISDRAALSTSSNFMSNVTIEIPRICLSLYVLNATSGETFFNALEQAIDRLFIKQQTQIHENATDLQFENVTYADVENLFAFNDKCAIEAWKMAERYVPRVDWNDLGSLTFNWIQCIGVRNATSFNNLFGSYFSLPFRNITKLKPAEQEALVAGEWQRHQRELYNVLLDQLLQEGNHPVDARIEALALSFQQANGFDVCQPNSVSGAWFWFTVMTTIGYGNVAPTTTGGRAMVYTIGFISILQFAHILGTAGSIITTIVDDFVKRTKRIGFVSLPWVACLMWGVLYYAWMVAIAGHTVNWKQERLGEDFSFRNAYWFSYISTTTVGLGDFYLEHEVLLRRDLLIFGLLFLGGFILLANFLVKLNELRANMLTKKRKTFEETLQDSDVPCFPTTHLSETMKSISDKLHETTTEDNKNGLEDSKEKVQEQNASPIKSEDD